MVAAGAAPAVKGATGVHKDGSTKTHAPRTGGKLPSIAEAADALTAGFVPRTEVTALDVGGGARSSTDTDMDAEAFTPPHRETWEEELRNLSLGYSPVRHADEQVTTLINTRQPVQEIPPTPPFPASGDVPEALASIHGVLSTLAQTVGSLQVQMSDLPTRREMTLIHQAQMREVTTMIDAKTKPLVEQHVALEKRVTKLERAKSMDPNDPSRKRIVFLGMPQESAEARVDGVERWLSQNFPKARVLDIGNEYKGAYKSNGRTITSVSYAEFSSMDVRNQIMTAVKARSLKCEINGKEVTVKSAMSRTALRRNGVLKAASRVISADPKAASKEVKVVYVGSRGVTVDGNVAFSQPPGDEDGSFQGEFSHLALP